MGKLRLAMFVGEKLYLIRIYRGTHARIIHRKSMFENISMKRVIEKGTGKPTHENIGKRIHVFMFS